jgi:ubiquitin-protein ligase
VFNFFVLFFEMAAKSSLRASRRTLFILQEIRKKGESLDLPGESEMLDLPDKQSSPSSWWHCKLEFPLTKDLVAAKGDDAYDDAARYKLIVVHVHVREGLYGGGWYRLEIDLRETPAYPNEPPRARYLTKMWHPNVDTDGKICHSHLKMSGPANGTWSPLLRLEALIKGLVSMFNLDDPAFNPDDPLNIEAAEQWHQDNDAFRAKAKQYVQDFAKKVDIDDVNLADNVVDN